MLYEYVCSCDRVLELIKFAPIGAPNPENFICRFCGEAPVRRVSLPQVKPADAEPYFNYTIGEVCKGTKDFEAKLALNQRKATDKDGIERRFVPVYPEEGRKLAEAASTTDAELERLL